MLWPPNWRKDSDRARSSATPSAEAIDLAFARESEFLLWMAEVITGDEDHARQCVTDARRITGEQSGIFVEWLTQWARLSTIYRAIERNRADISTASQPYAGLRCAHGGHAPLDIEELQGLQSLRPREVVAALDPFVRTVMILRSVPRCAIQDCALRLGTSRAAVLAACCASQQWFHERESHQPFLLTASRRSSS